LSADSSNIWSAYVAGSPASDAPSQRNYKNHPREKFKFWRENEFSPYFRHFPAEIPQNVVLLCSFLFYIVIWDPFADFLKNKMLGEIWMKILAPKFKLKYFRFPVTDLHQILRVDAVSGPVQGARIRAQLSQTIQKLFKKNDLRKSRKSDFCVQICKNFPRRKNPGKRYPLRRTPTQSASDCQIWRKSAVTFSSKSPREPPIKMRSKIFEKFYFRFLSHLEPGIRAPYGDPTGAQNKKNWASCAERWPRYSHFT